MLDKKYSSTTLTIVIILVLACAGVLAQWIIEKNTKNELKNSLNTVLETSHKALGSWSKHQKSRVELWAKRTTTTSLIEELLDLPQDSDVLQQSVAQQALRGLLEPIYKSRGYQGFFVIAPNYINIASSRDLNLATTSLLTQQPDVMQRLWQGETLVSLPLESDVSLVDSMTDASRVVNKYHATMFVTTPVRDYRGNIIALLSFRINPFEDFTTLLRQGRVGDSGETYAFNHQALLISESRFEEQLTRIGLIKANQSAMLNIKITDPGFNLVTESQSEATQSFASQNTDSQSSTSQPLTLMAQNALAKQSGWNVDGYRDYRGVPVVGAWLWDDELQFGLTSEIDKEEAYQSIYLMRWVTGSFTLLVILLFALLLWLQRRTINQQEKLQQTLADLVEEKSRALGSEQHRLQSIIDNATDGIVILDEDAFILQVSPAMNTILGFSVSVVGDDVGKLFDSESAQKLQKILVSEAGEKRNVHMTEVELSGNHISGKSVPLNVSIGSADVDDKRFYTLIVRDITESKNAQKQLMERESRLNTILDSTVQLSGLLDTQGVLLDANKASLSMINANKEDVIGRPFWECPWWEGLDELQQKLKQGMLVAAAGERCNWTARHPLPEGGYAEVDFTLTPVFDDKGKVIFIIPEGHDITEIRNTERALQEAVQENRLLLNSVSEGIYGIDFNGVITFANPAAATLLGYEIDELIEQSAHDLFHHSHEDGSNYLVEQCPMTQCLHEGVLVQQSDDVFWRKDNTQFHVEYSAQPILKDGQVTGAVVSFRDISARLAAENAIVNAKELAEQANRTKSEFLANMSHEIRTPMNAIMGLTELCLDNEKDITQRSYLSKVMHASKSMLAIINDILDFAKLESGHIGLDHIPFTFADIVENLRSIAAAYEKSNDVELIFDMECNAKRYKGDPVRLGQVLNNLVSNALKFTEQGEVVVSAREVETNNQTTVMQFDIRDTGVGISDDLKDSIFSSFTQADASLTRQHGGLGLGLSISKTLVELMQGRIWFDSNQSGGTTFSFTVELRNLGEEETPLPLDSFSDIKLLIVDDNESSRIILQNMLSSMSFDATSVSSGFAALDLLERDNGGGSESPFDMVILDWKMPRMDGVATAKAINQDEKVVVKPQMMMLSAYGNEALTRDAQNEGVQHLLCKPVSSSLLFNTLVYLFKDRYLEANDEIQNEHQSNSQATSLHCFSDKTILVAEDNSTNQDVASGFLQSMEANVVLAADGQQALDLMDKISVDAVLMDVQMPVMDGYVTTQQIRQNDKFAKIPIIAMTANALPSDRQQCLAAGMNDYLSKPIDKYQLSEVLSKWIQSSGVIDTAISSLPVSDVDGSEKTKVATVTDKIPQKLGSANNDESRAVFDHTYALQQFSGDQALLNKNLRRYLERYKDLHSQLDSLLVSEQWDTAEAKVHDIKGVSGNLGFSAFHHMCAEMDNALKQHDGESVNRQESAFWQSFRATNAYIEHYLVELAQDTLTADEEVSQSNQDAVDITALNVALSRLKEELEEASFVDNEQAEQVASMVERTDYDGVAQLLRDTIAECEYEDALALVNELMINLDIVGE